MDVSRVGIDTSIHSHHVSAVALHLRGLLVPLSVSVSLSDSFWLSAAEKANAFFHQTHVQSKIRGGLMTRRRALMRLGRRRWHAPGYLHTCARPDSVDFWRAWACQAGLCARTDSAAETKPGRVWSGSVDSREVAGCARIVLLQRGERVLNGSG